MTSPLLDPQLEAFWAANPELLVDPTTLAPSAPPDITSRPTAEKVAIEMASAFVVAAVVIRARLQQEPPPANPTAVAGQAWQHHAPIWMRFMVPAVKQAYRLGRVSNLTPEELDAMATAYAEDLGEYMNTSSAEVLTAGFNQQMSGAKWSREVAWQRASAAYGVDAANMRGIIATLMHGGDQGVNDPVTAAAKLAIDKALLSRAELVGDTEQHRSTQMGRAMSWLLRRQRGDLPEGAQRRWRTHNHEHDCPICGPMDGVTAYLDTAFVLPDGQQLWAPGAHPGCVCEVDLVDAEGEVIGKALAGDPYDRLKDGRFASTEHRSREVTYAEPVDPVVADILEQASKLNGFGVETGPDLDNLFGKPAAKNLFGPPQALFRAVPENLFGAPQELFASKQELFSDETTPKAAARRKPARIVIIAGKKRPGPPPAPKHESHYLPMDAVSDYYYEMWGEPGEAQMGDHVDFDEMNDFYTGQANWLGDREADDDRAEIKAFPSKSIWSMAPDQIEDVSKDEWSDTIAAALPIWHQALHHVDSITAQLTAADLREITMRAGYSSRDPDAMRQHIASVVHDQNSPDRSLEEAFADYVTWTRPELVGEDGAEFGHHLAALMGANDYADFAVDPQRVFSFNQGFNGDSTALFGEYEVSHIVYHSALADWGRDAPLGQLSIQELEMEPAGPSQWSPPEHGEDDDTILQEDKHPWD